MGEDKLSDAAKELGTQHGKAKGGFVSGLNLTAYAAKKILEGYEAGDEDVLNLCPKPLSGEWADDPTPMYVIEQIADQAGQSSGSKPEGDDDLLDVYENAYREAFWEEAIRQCKEMLKDD